MPTSVGEGYRAKHLTAKLQACVVVDDGHHEAACRAASAEALCTIADASEEIARLLAIIAAALEDRAVTSKPRS